MRLGAGATPQYRPVSSLGHTPSANCARRLGNATLRSTSYAPRPLTWSRTEGRRLVYLLRFVGGGLRPSSEANLRWRDLNRTTRPSGWQRFIGRASRPDDLILPRQDATQRRVNVSLEMFYADLQTVGLPRRRQYESRAAFRNPCLRAGANPFHVDLITHPKATSASELYDRIEDQWEGMCAAVQRIDAGAWFRTPSAVPAQSDRTGTGPNEKPPASGRACRGRNW
jgi:hypothetical protein